MSDMLRLIFVTLQNYELRVLKELSESKAIPKTLFGMSSILGV